MKSSKALIILVASVLLVAVIGGAVFLGQSGSQSDAGADTIVEGDLTAEDADGEVRIINIETGNHYFAPKEIRVTQGERIRIVMTVKDTAHDFTIDELGVSIPETNPGQTVSTEFTADEVGEFTYYCSISNHRELGQSGKLIVEE